MNYYCPNDNSFGLSDFSDIAQIVIAVVNIFLALYIFVYQRRRDTRNDTTTALLNEQNIKLQWFKELIIQPNINTINNYYDKLEQICNQLKIQKLPIETREVINANIKKELSDFRIKFIDVLLHVDKNFYDKILLNLDELNDALTLAIFDDNLDLTVTNDYEPNILSPILYSKNILLSTIYNYKGFSE